MAVQLTPHQQAVVEYRGDGLLVSAAAGSGKTKVLVERLFRRCLGEEQADLNEFLIITYTKASAAELRERIAGELSERLAEAPEDAHLRRQQLLVYQADIKTIDSFCTALMRENVHQQQEHGLTADFRVMDEAEAAVMQQRVLGRVLEEFYAHMDEGRIALADTFGFGRDDRRLEELVLELYRKVQSHAYPIQWLEQQRSCWHHVPETVGETDYGRELLTGLARTARHWAKLLEDGCEQMAGEGFLERSYAPAFLQAKQQMERLAQAAEENWAAAAMLSIQFPKLGSSRGCENPALKDKLYELWGQFKKSVEKSLEPFSVSEKDLLEDLRRSAPAMDALLTLCGDFAAAYRKEKLRRNAADFSDQEHGAVALLLNGDGTPTELAISISRRYREVMVDEYQDTNQVQNCIFSAISNGGKQLFTVGDVKQSIYRFRLADPTIFLEKYLSYPAAEQAREGQAAKITLSQNFRSRQPILDSVNFVFRNIMSCEAGELDYGEEESLRFGATYLPEREDCHTELHLLEVNREDHTAQIRNLEECRLIAKRIRQLLDSGFPVTDEHTRSLRPCRPEDIVVLMRSPNAQTANFVQALAEREIPCAVPENGNFFAAMEIAVTYALLQIIDNPRQDVPLITVLRSPLVGFSPDKLAFLRSNHPKGDFYDALSASEDEEAAAFLERLRALRLRSLDMSVHRLLWHIYNQWNVLGIFGAMDGGDRRRENLIVLCDQARSFESAGFKGVFAFVRQLRALLERGKQPEVVTGNMTGGVRLMSIHSSKGLEFPIVILANLSREFNRVDLQKPILVHPKMGLGPRFIDLERHITYETIARMAVGKRLEQELRAEEMRLLYVAMTRAKEKLIVICAVKSIERTVRKLLPHTQLPVSPETVGGAKSMADWILLPLLCRREAQCLYQAAGAEAGELSPTEDTPWDIYLHSEVETAETVSEQEIPEKVSSAAAFDPQALAYVYPYRTATAMAAKVVATQLKGREKDKEVAEESIQPFVPPTFEAPHFLSDKLPLTAAQRGTATHLVMQYISPQEHPSQTVKRLRERNLLTEEQAAAVNIGSIQRFLASDLAKELWAAERMEREYRFSLLMPAEEYDSNLTGGDALLLQGVVDLFTISDGAITVVDFKTDYVTEETLPDRVEQYRTQLLTYSRALERIFALPVRQEILYFLGIDRTVTVEPELLRNSGEK